MSYRSYELETISFTAPVELVPALGKTWVCTSSLSLRGLKFCFHVLLGLVLLFLTFQGLRDNRSSRSSLVDGFDSLEEGGLRASSSYSREINEHDNDKAIENLQDRVSFLKREFLVLTNVKVHGKVLLVFKVLPAMVLLLFKLTGDIHEEVESHNQLLDRVGNKMDGSRGVMMGTMDRFKKVFEKKSARKTCSLVGYFTLAFIFIYYLIRMLGYFTLG
ncbi:Bet1-like SNARE 1-2 [Glycine soja]|uniref:Bet1-like SNARE 1-2 n=1 Tax=Glycine soja TaxID=3848 RepID=A0A445IG47_GLYSO|nr:Bet1-like SNARE 1-2 [Glycine soja]